MHNNGENIGLIRSLLNGSCHDFMERFGSFLDQSPSFLHSVGKDRFFPAFFFGTFATAFDSGVINNNERIFFRFDNYGDHNRKGNLKVAVLTNERDRRGYRIVRCFTIADRLNSFGSRFSEEEIQWMEDELQRQGVVSRIGRFAWEEYKVSVWGDDMGQDDTTQPIRCVRLPEGEAFTENSAFPCGSFEEVARTVQQDYLSTLVGRLASNNADNVVNITREILEYIIGIYDRYSQVLSFNDKESDYHGFLSGFLMNFRYRHTAGIYLELFVGGGYTDITFLVRGIQRLRDSVPIIIELKAGRESAIQALEQTRSYVKRCPISSISIHTSSKKAVCAGLNFDLNRRRLQLSIESFLERESSLVERLFEPVANQVIEENVRGYILYPAFGIPAVPDIRGRNSRIFSYTTGFTFGSAAFARGTVSIGRNQARVTKHLFRYHDHNDNRMLGPQGRISQVNVRERALTMVFYAPSINGVVVLDIRHMLAHQFPMQGLDLSRWQNARVHEVVCELNPNRRAEDDLGLTVAVTPFQSPTDYLQHKGNQSFQGNLFQVGGVGNVHSIVSIMMNTGWQDVDRHRELFQEISNVLFPLRWVVNRNNAREIGFHSILHGLFYTCDNPARVIIEFQLGGRKLDLVLLRSVESRSSTNPTGIELKFAAAAGELPQRRIDANNQLDNYMHCRGFKRVTDGDTVVLSYAIFNDRARGPNTLISNPDVLHIKNPLEHSSIHEFP